MIASKLFHTFLLLLSFSFSLFAIMYALEFSFSPVFTFLTQFQVLITGICAIIAAVVTTDAIKRQVQQATTNHSRELEINNLQSQYDQFHNSFSVASTFAGDMAALISRAEQQQYEEYFRNQLNALDAGLQDQIYSFPVNSNYFIVFDSLCTDLGFLDGDLPSKVSSWYNRAKGMIDTVKGINSGFYDDGSLVEIVRHLVEELGALRQDGSLLVDELNSCADINKEIANNYQTQIQGKIRI